jgi:hypothetical protein
VKVVKIKITNFNDIPQLENFEKEINGQNIILLGENGVGKSSVMQFIQIALGSKKEIPINAIGEGTVITDDNGREWKFDLVFKKNKPVITVTSPDGIKDDSKSILAKIIGAVNFDIDEFVSWSQNAEGRKKQVETYKSFLDAETKQFIYDAETRVKKHYDERTEKNKEIKIYEGALSEHPFRKIHDTIPSSPINIDEIKIEINKGIEHNTKIDDIQTRLDGRVKEISDIDAEIERLVAKKKDLQEKNVQANAFLSANRKIDLQSLMDKRDEADILNDHFKQRVDYDQKLKHLNLLKEESGELTVLIDTSRQAISDAIKDCELPVDGLSFDAENLLFNGVPVTTTNLSTSEIMELGIRMKIAENPKLGLLFIERGESLGIKRLNLIRDIAKKYNMQIFMEQVDRGNEKLTIEIMENVLGE